MQFLNFDLIINVLHDQLGITQNQLNYFRQYLHE